MIKTAGMGDTISGTGFIYHDTTSNAVAQKQKLHESNLKNEEIRLEQQNK